MVREKKKKKKKKKTVDKIIKKKMINLICQLFSDILYEISKLFFSAMEKKVVEKQVNFYSSPMKMKFLWAKRC